jgi:hypothetical protein
MQDGTTSPFRATALRQYVQAKAAAPRLVGLPTWHIVLVWLLLALCVAAAGAVLLALLPLASP